MCMAKNEKALTSIIPAADRASFAPSAYDLIRPPAPRRIPPKYLVTTTIVLVRPSFLIISSIGIPAVPEGSPSSLDLCISAFSPKIYA